MKKTDKKKLFKIAIVGSPNVGKSTFFNLLIGGRRSIVDDFAGVTRDRVYARVNLSKFINIHNKKLEVEIIDTGGLFFESDSLFEGIQRQVEFALKECDCVLFLTDGRMGITSSDRKIVPLIRNSKKPCILLVNKLDSPELLSNNSEFYNLGLGEPVVFSCQNNFRKHMASLIEKLINTCGLKQKKNTKLNTEEELDSEIEAENSENTNNTEKISEDTPSFVLLGKPNTGKSSILNSLVGYERSLVHDEAGTTRDALDTFLHYKNTDILLIDTAGLRKKNKIQDRLERFSVDRTIKGLVRSSVAILVLDATEISSNNLNNIVSRQEKRLASLIESRKKGCVIVLNKWDLVENKTNQDFELYSKKLKQELQFVDYAPVIISSAKTGQRIDNILDQALIVYENSKKTFKTSLLNTVLKEITSLRQFGSKLKIYYITQTGSSPTEFTLFVSQPKYLDENYLKFLEKSFRKEFDLTGVPIYWQVRKSENKSRKAEN